MSASCASTSGSSGPDLQSLLATWGMSKTVCEAFEKGEVSLANVKFLSKESIQNLIPAEGPRAVFEHHLAELPGPAQARPAQARPAEGDQPKQLVSQATPSSELDAGPPSAKKSRTELLEPFSFVQNELYHKLKSTETDPKPEGSIILSFYAQHRELTSHMRDLLVERVIYSELGCNFSKRITKERFSELGDLIKELFPTEDKLTYYDEVTKDKKTFVEGCLRTKFYGIRRTFIKAGLIQKKTLVEEVKLLEDLGANDDDDDDDADDNYVWLLNNYSPPNLVRIKWEETFLRRMRVQKKCERAFQYMNRFPSLTTDDGWELLVHDAYKIQPALESAVDWDTFFANIIRILSLKKVLKFSEDISEDEKRVTALINVPHIFKVRNVPKSPSAAKGSNSWRPSREEMKEGFILQVQNISAIKTKLSERSKRVGSFGYSMQPVPVIVGDINNIKQCFVCLDKYRWPVDSITHAVEVALKVDFALDLQYPPEARPCWLYVQRLLFKLELPTDYAGDKALRSFMASSLKDYVF